MGKPYPVVTIRISLVGALFWAVVLGGITVLAAIGACCLLGRLNS